MAPTDSAVTVYSGAAERARPAPVPWERLAGAGAEPMQSHAWALAAARTLHAADASRIVTVRRGAALAAVAPLVGDAPCRCAAGSRSSARGTLGEPCRLLSPTAGRARALCRALVRTAQPLLLPSHGPWRSRATGCAAAARGRAIACRRAGRPLPARGFRRRLDGNYSSACRHRAQSIAATQAPAARGAGAM